jgi:hypothetical protein
MPPPRAAITPEPIAGIHLPFITPENPHAMPLNQIQVHLYLEYLSKLVGRFFDIENRTLFFASNSIIL